MARLANDRVGRAGRNLEYAFALDLADLVGRAGEGRQLRAQVEVLAQRVDDRPIVVQDATARVGMTDESQTEQVLDFALLPVDGVDGVGQRRELGLVW